MELHFGQTINSFLDDKTTNLPCSFSNNTLIISPRYRGFQILLKSNSLVYIRQIIYSKANLYMHTNFWQSCISLTKWIKLILYCTYLSIHARTHKLMHTNRLAPTFIHVSIHSHIRKHTQSFRTLIENNDNITFRGLTQTWEIIIYYNYINVHI